MASATLRLISSNSRLVACISRDLRAIILPRFRWGALWIDLSLTLISMITGLAFGTVLVLVPWLAVTSLDASE